MQSPGVFGLDIGVDSVFLTVPTPTSLLAASSVRYGIMFSATATSEILKFTNRGHIIGSGYYGSELILDDVVVNQVPVPQTSVLAALALAMMAFFSRKRLTRARLHLPHRITHIFCLTATRPTTRS